MQPSELEQVAQAICKERGWSFVQTVGEGAFKETFQVNDRNGVSFALKIYKAATVRKREAREIAAMMRCNHERVARLISVDGYDLKGQKFLTLTEEFLHGGTLTQRGKLGREECLALGEQLNEALAHIAGLGLVHRDIKPDNVMFRSEKGGAVLTDFGVARDLGDSSITPTWAPRGPGTPFFASPEQLNNEKFLTDWRSDQFTLGVVLSYVTLGAHPYWKPGTQEAEAVDRVASRSKPEETFLAAAEALKLPVLVKMVAPWPVQRFRTPDALSKAWFEQRG